MSLRPLKILSVHNRYLIGGGEDESHRAEVRLLKEQGHTVNEYVEDNRRIKSLGGLRTAFRTVWSQESYDIVRKRLQAEHHDLMHVQNFFPLISPSVYYAARAEGVPIIQTLRNYRLMCLNGLFFRQGRICEECVGTVVPWPGVKFACYRNNRLASATVTAMLIAHRVLNTWVNMVDRYIVLTDFARQKFLDAGLPEAKLKLKPNFVHPDPGPGKGSGGYALYIGRLSPEKGIATLLSAWESLEKILPLKIVGDGPLSDKLPQRTGIEYLGRLSLEIVYALIGEATVLIFPSEWYEGLPRTIIEAYAKGTPVIASKTGAMINLVNHRCTGLHFLPGDVDGLIKQVEWILNHPIELAMMRVAARTEFETKYTASRNYQILSDIYTAVLSHTPGTQIE